MKFIIALLLTALLSFTVCLYLDWWTIALAAFVVALVIPLGPLKNFIAAFTALLLLWGGLSWWISAANNHLLAHKISMVLLKTDNIWALISGTAFIGALVAGMGALTGSFLRSKK